MICFPSKVPPAPAHIEVRRAASYSAQRGLRRIRLYSAVSLLSFFSLAACASREPAPSAAPQLSIQLSNFSPIETPETREYLAYMQTRLTQGFSHLPNKPAAFLLLLVKSSDPLAFSAGSGVIVFSSGLVKALPSEAELAFVLAHEFSHELLAHDPKAPPPERAQMELEADALALEIVQRAGYDASRSFNALLNAYRAVSHSESDRLYPALDERLENLRHRLKPPSGTVSRRDFAVFKLKLDALK